MGQTAATVYLQTSIRNRPPFDFDRYLYLGARRTIGDDHIRPERWHFHTFGYERFGFAHPRAAEDIGFAPGTKILVSAGNRLEAEITATFASVITSVMKECPDTGWLLLGARDEQKLMKTITEAGGAAVVDRVRLSRYVLDIGDHLGACAVYVNPRRSGGAVSMALSVYAGTPILTFPESDSCNFVLPSMICESEADYAARLIELLRDDALRDRVMSSQMEAFQKHHSIAGSVQDLVGHLQAALADFKDRQPTTT